jgi:hypothetical protein
MNNDADHLQLLAIFHFVVGGMAGLFSLFPLIHLFIGVMMVSGAFDKPEEAFPAAAMGWFFIALASTFILCGLAIATCIILAGRFLMRRTRYTFCLVMAAIECVFVPFGTVLGVFTIIVLQRPSVRQLFGQLPATQPTQS